MGTLGAHNGPWGLFTDFIDLDLGNTTIRGRDFTIGKPPLPADSTASLDPDFKAMAWTSAGEGRYLDHDIKSGRPIESLNFNGPMIGATFRW